MTSLLTVGRFLLCLFSHRVQEFYWIVSECFEDITIVQSAACAQSVEAFNLSSASSGPEVKWSADGLDCVHGHGLWWR